MGDWAFWLARWALATAGAAFLCYVLVLVGLVLVSHFLSPRRRPAHLRPRRDERRPGGPAGSSQW